MNRTKIILVGIFTCMSVYLFASAPPPLNDQNGVRAGARMVEVEKLFNAVNAANEAARTIYTKRIVGVGLKIGFKYGEDWAEPNVEEGPLPALFLRLVAQQLETKPPRLGLYLGSDEPINKSNLFTGEQAKVFTTLKQTRAPIFKQDEMIGYVAMYPDIAGAQPCVACHNDHLDSPKTDWELNDVMGATTWTYPKGLIGSSEYLETLDAVFQSIEETYALYLEKTESFQQPIPITDEWPSKTNVVLPNAKIFMAEVRRASAETILIQLASNQPKEDVQ
ncbi:DUF3365 domain-containing protein [Amylibacter sp. SFDW26]|uniref:c-type heme family protein n=1 Tax=Amylibacter sp. SFDW26 TaxID=2652722 RepID=UPI00186AB9A8|nr:DUF3365 domain-containing protein [Amylibacter sp. SFDW26]